jgi:hypothetical protein
MWVDVTGVKGPLQMLHDLFEGVKGPLVFLSHDGILSIMEPFTNFSFARWNFGYHEAFHELFFHTMEF